MPDPIESFNLCSVYLNYWWTYSKQLDSIIIQQDSIIKTYAKETGASAATTEELKKVLRNKDAINKDCGKELDETQNKLTAENRRKKRWRKATFVVAVVAVAEAAFIYIVTIL